MLQSLQDGDMCVGGGGGGGESLKKNLRNLLSEKSKLQKVRKSAKMEMHWL